MIEPRYVQTMARYNCWQNEQLVPVLNAMSLEELTQDRGAFFGGILATANHLLWGDTLWMSRFCTSVVVPEIEVATHTQLHTSIESWTQARQELDGDIQRWADGLQPSDLALDLAWYSGTAKRQMSSSMSTAVTHFFNHQTHHRGQIHAMLTAAKQPAPVSDLVFMLEDV